MSGRKWYRATSIIVCRYTGISAGTTARSSIGRTIWIDEARYFAPSVSSEPAKRRLRKLFRVNLLIRLRASLASQHYCRINAFVLSRYYRRASTFCISDIGGCQDLSYHKTIGVLLHLARSLSHEQAPPSLPTLLRSFLRRASPKIKGRIYVTCCANLSFASTLKLTFV